MISIIAALAGIFGMIALWCLAWLILQGRAPAPPARPSPSRAKPWQNEPTPERTTSLPPPDWLFEDHTGDDADGIPIRRARAISSANTVCFKRTELDLGAPTSGDMTQILADEALADTSEAYSSGDPPCSTSLFTGPRAAERD